MPCRYQRRMPARQNAPRGPSDQPLIGGRPRARRGRGVVVVVVSARLAVQYCSKARPRVHERMNASTTRCPKLIRGPVPGAGWSPIPASQLEQRRRRGAGRRGPAQATSSCPRRSRDERSAFMVCACGCASWRGPVPSRPPGPGGDSQRPCLPPPGRRCRRCPAGGARRAAARAPCVLTPQACDRHASSRLSTESAAVDLYIAPRSAADLACGSMELHERDRLR